MSEILLITQALGGDMRGNSALVPCPICQPEGRKDQRGLSLTAASERTLFKCHKSGCKAPYILAELRSRGIIQGHGFSVKKSQEEMDRSKQERRKQFQEKQQHCDKIFNEAVPITDTPVEWYLQNRGIVGLKGHKMRNTLRYHPALYHAPSKQNLPCMIARIRGSNGYPMGLHRTYLKPDGSAKANVDNAKMMLGPASGGSIRFGPNRPIIALAEGIETALSIGVSTRMTVWATLSTSGLKGLILPPMPTAQVVVIAADNDEAGLSAAEIMAGRLEAEGRKVALVAPKAVGLDFNDVLRGQGIG